MGNPGLAGTNTCPPAWMHTQKATVFSVTVAILSGGKTAVCLWPGGHLILVVGGVRRSRGGRRWHGDPYNGRFIQWPVRKLQDRPHHQQSLMVGVVTVARKGTTIETRHNSVRHDGFQGAAAHQPRLRRLVN